MNFHYKMNFNYYFAVIQVNVFKSKFYEISSHDSLLHIYIHIYIYIYIINLKNAIIKVNIIALLNLN
jgi:hypothetical protein